MNSVKWNDIKKSAVEFVNKKMYGVKQGGSKECMLAELQVIEEVSDGRKKRSAKDVIEEWHDSVIETINRWDIRMAKSLIDLFPDSVPKSLRSRRISGIDKDEDGDWSLYF